MVFIKFSFNNRIGDYAQKNYTTQHTYKANISGCKIKAEDTDNSMQILVSKKHKKITAKPTLLAKSKISTQKIEGARGNDPWRSYAVLLLL